MPIVTACPSSIDVKPPTELKTCVVVVDLYRSIWELYAVGVRDIDKARVRIHPHPVIARVCISASDEFIVHTITQL